MPRAAQQLSYTAAPPPRPLKRGKLANRPVQVKEARERGLQDQWHEADSIDPNKPLTDKQKLLVKLIASGESISSATERAGYVNSPTYGYRLIKQPNARLMLDAEKAKYEASVQMTRKKVMDGLLEGVEMAKLAGEPASMIAGWREIGKMCGYYEPVTRKVDITVNGNVVMERLNRMSDADLLKMIQADVTAAVELEVLEEIQREED
jgi:phage terminase small subunit